MYETNSHGFDQGRNDKDIIIGVVGVVNSSHGRLILTVFQDFGTTFSGISYVLTAKPDTVHLITSWPGARGVQYEKCPKILKYENDGSLK